MKYTKAQLQDKSGFSLVEMLVVIAVIGILAAIAVPNIGKINDAANDSKNRRNAQQLASVCGAAQAAGRDFVVDALGANPADTATTTTVLAAVVAGETINDVSSPFNGTYFGVPNLSAAEQTLADEYLTVKSGMLVYTQDQ